MKACHRIVVQNDVEKCRKLLDQIYGDRRNNQSDVKRVTTKSTRASFPLDAKSMSKCNDADDPLPPVVEKQNTHEVSANLEAKNIVKVKIIIYEST